MVDSRYRTKDSLSNSDFFVELPYPVTVSKGSTMLIDGVCLSHSWSTVQLNVNEWTPYFVAALLYLHTQGAGSNLVAWGSVLSSLGFSASKLVVFHGKPAPVASTTRYLALAALIVEVYGTHQ